ncbi:MAG: nucleotidyltransferase domain-containing protein, partial [Candidatus Dormibacteraeota bacterium]|nr:nucleotidyltransferase domain-containing protein [Candidatus Dormibacteraeota bacterium]
MRDARQLAAHVRRIHASICAVCVFGSVARGDATPGSDIDLLVLTDDRTVTRRAVTDGLPPQPRAFPISVACFSVAGLAAVMRRGDSFARHLQNECVVAWQRDGEATAVLAIRPTATTAAAEVSRHLDRLQAFERPQRFNDRFLFPLADLYVIAKAVVMARLTVEGAPEYNRARAFAAMRQRHPELGRSLDRLGGLSPFWEVTSGRDPGA